jgi:chromosome partitioning protein
MVITIASFKGGVAKSTTAVHCAAFLQQLDSTLLVDGDPNRSVTDWGKTGKLPFAICDERQAAITVPRYKNIVIDTRARPEEEDLKQLALGCHLLIIPCTPDPLSIKTLELTLGALNSVGADRYRVLLTSVPPPPQTDGAEAREFLEQLGLPIFKHSVRRFKAFQKAVYQGTTVKEVREDRGALGWKDYELVGKEMVEIVNALTYASTQVAHTA